MAFLAAIPAWAYLATTAAGAAMSIAGSATRNPGLQAGGGALSLLGSIGGGGMGAGGAASAAGGVSGSSFPFLSALSLGSQLATGILGKTQAAAQSSAQADMLRQQAKFAEQRQIQRDLALLSREHAAAAASGLSASSGSPLASGMDTTRDLEMNAANTRRTGEMQAWSPRMQAGNYYRQIPGILDDAFASKAGQSVLGYLIDQRRLYS